MWISITIISLAIIITTGIIIDGYVAHLKKDIVPESEMINKKNAEIAHLQRYIGELEGKVKIYEKIYDSKIQG